MPKFDIALVIGGAKIGSERKAAQEDTCGPFAAALFDVLNENAVRCCIFTASLLLSGRPYNHHAVVKVGAKFYDSLGEFTEERVRKQSKFHKGVSLTIEFKEDHRDCCYDPELEVLHQFLLEALRKSIGKPGSAARPPPTLESDLEPSWHAAATDDLENCRCATISGINYRVARICAHFHWAPEGGPWSPDGYAKQQDAMTAATIDARRRA